MAVHAELSPAEAADRLALRELFDAYAHCADRRDDEGKRRALHRRHRLRRQHGRRRPRADLRQSWARTVDARLR
jgi:hypothetical protein